MSQSPDNQSNQNQGTTGNFFGVGIFILGFLAGVLVAFVLREKMSMNSPKPVSGVTSSEIHETKSKMAPEMGDHGAESKTANSNEDHEQDVEISKTTRDRFLTVDFMSLLQDAELHRFRFEGETRGVKLSKIRTGSIYERVGFKDGDIVEKINGIAIGEVEKAPSKMRNELPGAEKIIFVVRRGEQKVTLKIKVTNQP